MLETSMRIKAIRSRDYNTRRRLDKTEESCKTKARPNDGDMFYRKVI